ncbi:hypothetical protein DBV15_08307, partial [Temnothorax longispinosus]
NPHYRQPFLDVARYLFFSSRRDRRRRSSIYSAKARRELQTREVYTPRRAQELQRTLGGDADGESRNVTFDPHQCAAGRRSLPRGASSGSQTRG